MTTEELNADKWWIESENRGENTMINLLINTGLSKSC